MKKLVTSYKIYSKYAITTKKTKTANILLYKNKILPTIIVFMLINTRKIKCIYC